jgi:hypothetical protein
LTFPVQAFDVTKELAPHRIEAYLYRCNMLVGLWAEPKSANIPTLYVTQMDFGIGLGV